MLKGKANHYAWKRWAQWCRLIPMWGCTFQFPFSWIGL